MTSPFFLIQDDDVLMFRTASDLESYVESPDINEYRAFDSSGLEMDFYVLDENGESKGFGVPILAVKIRPSDPPRVLVDELSETLKRFLRKHYSIDLPNQCTLQELVRKMKDMQLFLY